MSLRKVIFGLFFLSGFCGLLYQVVWMRLAFSHFGIITPVLSVVISVFMLGLSLGSWWGGAWAAKMKARGRFSAIYAYAAAELLIGVGAFVVPQLFFAGDTLLLPRGEMNSTSYLSFSALILAVSILPWCVVMGATFPLMMGFLKEQKDASATSFSFLYLANVLGAMCGTILTADVLVELLGFKRTLMAAGLCNFLIAGVSVVLGSRSAVRAASPSASPEAPPRVFPTEASSQRNWFYLILFLTGFTSMSLEVVWVRDFTPVLGTTVYAFALIVAVYLLATWSGSTAYRAAGEKALPVPVLLAALAVFAIFPVVINDPRLGLKKIGVLAGIFPFSFLLGYLTPSLIDRYSGGDPDRAGQAYAVNIVGCILGPLFASYIFLPYFGAKISMVLMALPYLALAAASFGELNRGWKICSGSAAAALFFCALFINRSYEERHPGGIVRRDATATVISFGSGMQKRLLVNGVGITELTTITKFMAHLPLAALREKPRSALNICFGMGTTYRSILRWEGVQVTAVELVPSVKEAFGYYHDDAGALLENPLGRIVIDDGRRFLRRTAERFDVITIDPPPPIEAAGSSLLYAEEFYALSKQRLRPSGILQQWFPGSPGPECQAIVRAVTNSFPHVRIFLSTKGWGVHILASMEPLHVPALDEFMARLPAAAERDLEEWEPGRSARDQVKQLLAAEMSLPLVLAGDTGTAVSDDRPFNEYYLLRRSLARYRRIRKKHDAV